MKVIKTLERSDDEIKRYLESQIMQEGLWNKKPMETLDKVWILYRPFRHITLNLKQSFSSTLIDEDFAGLISDPDEKFLLWRPRLAGQREVTMSELSKSDPYPGNEMAVQAVLDEHMQLRWNGQEKDDELRSELRTLQADPLSSIAFIVPRSPGGIRREEKLLDSWKASHAFVLASSMVLNCMPNDIILSAKIGDRVYVETVVAEFKNIYRDVTRLLLLETSGANSLKKAQKAGYALTRTSELYESCYKRIRESYPNIV